MGKQECDTDRGRFGGLEGTGTKADAADIRSSDIKMNNSCYNTMIAPILIMVMMPSNSKMRTWEKDQRLLCCTDDDMSANRRIYR